MVTKKQLYFKPTPKLFSRTAPESFSAKLLRTAIPQSYRFSQQLSVNAAFKAAQLLRKAALQSCYPMLFPGAALQSCAPKLFSKAVALKLRVCKPVHQSGSPKQFCEVARKSCAPNLLPKTAVQSYNPKAATLQTYTPKRLPKAILQSGSRKLLPEVAAES